MSEEFDAASYYTALYALISFLLVMLVVMLLYVACSKRYRLNWFERNLLEQAETKEMTQSQEALVGVESQAGSSRTLNRSPSEDKFWVPPNLQRQTSVCQSDPQDTSGDESAPGTPNTPLGIKVSPFAVQQIVVPSSEKALSPLARGEKHAVQPSTSNSSSSSSSRPRVSSMHTKLDHTKIDTSMYQKAPPSRTPSQQEDLRGSIRLRLAYDPAAGILTIRLIEAHDLQPKDFSGTADPYAKIRLLPDRTNVWQTRIHKKTLNPVFDEDFVFEVKPTALPRRILEILLYDFDAYSRHHSIGGVQLPLAHIDLTEKVTMWKGLGPGSEHDAKVELGELMVSVAYLPSAERLTVVVLKARNLRVVDESRTASDPYIKVSLMQNGKRVKKKKTSVARNTVNPVFNEAITFSVVREQLKTSTLEFCVMNDSILGQNDVLGQVLIGPDCKGEELEFFQEILTSKTAVAQWLVLGDAE